MDLEGIEPIKYLRIDIRRNSVYEPLNIFIQAFQLGYQYICVILV
jgi:hypothetical protein